jgi:hypothetical protein
VSTDWIKMRVDLRTHPKVVRMSSALRADKLRVIGGLFAVWSIFDAHSVDGVLEGYTFRAIDDELGWRGFAAQMATIEWLVERADQGLEAPRFEEHNGQSAKRRAMETERKRLEREAEKAAADAAKAATKAGQASAPDADKSVTREEKKREEKDQETSNLTVASAQPSAEPPALQLVGDTPKGPPDCPHLAVLALWAEVLPAMPQHLPEQWKGARADHLRTRWRETAALKGWTEQAHGLAYLRKLFAYVGQSAFLTGRAPPSPGKRPFAIELEWLVNPTNWARVHEGKYHQDAAA